MSACTTTSISLPLPPPATTSVAALSAITAANAFMATASVSQPSMLPRRIDGSRYCCCSYCCRRYHHQSQKLSIAAAAAARPHGGLLVLYPLFAAGNNVEIRVRGATVRCRRWIETVHGESSAEHCCEESNVAAAVVDDDVFISNLLSV